MMPSANLRLSNDQRKNLRQAIRAALLNSIGTQAHIDAVTLLAGRNVNDLSKEDLIAVLGVDVATAMTAPAAAATVEADPIQTAVQAVLEPLGKGDFNAFRDRLEMLAAVAHKPAAPAAIAVMPLPADAAAMDAASVFPSLAGTYAANVTVPVHAEGGARVPALDAHYEMPASLPAIISTLYRRHRNVFLTGPAGTGKTSLGQQIAARLRAPFFHVECSEATDAPFLTGQLVPDGETVKWRDGVLTAAIRTPGAVVLIDEPSTARPGALMVLQGVLGDTRQLTIPETGECVPVAPGVVFLVADNTNGTGDNSGQYNGTAAMNRATLDRMAITVEFSYASKEAETRILVNKTGCTEKLAEMLVAYADATRALSIKGTIVHGLGMRRLLALGELLTDGEGVKSAVDLAVLNTAPADDREHLRQLATALLPEADVIAARMPAAKVAAVLATGGARTDTAEPLLNF